MFRHIMFDLDGTVTDSGRAIMSSVQSALSRLGYENEPEEKLRTFIGPSLFDSFHREYGFEGELCDRAVAYYREVYEGGLMYDVDVYDGIPELLSELKKDGFVIYLVTSKPLRFSQKIIEHLGLSEYFDYEIAPELKDHNSDKARLIEKAITCSGAERNECIMIGDTYFDILGAKDAGISSIGVTFGFGSVESLTEAGATYLADTAEDIRRIIMDSGKKPNEI